MRDRLPYPVGIKGQQTGTAEWSVGSKELDLGWKNCRSAASALNFGSSSLCVLLHSLFLTKYMAINCECCPWSQLLAMEKFEWNHNHNDRYLNDTINSFSRPSLMFKMVAHSHRVRCHNIELPSPTQTININIMKMLSFQCSESDNRIMKYWDIHVPAE